MKGKRQNQLTDEHIAKMIATYQYRTEEDRYSKRIGMERIAEDGYNLNISRYISTAVGEEEISLEATNGELVEIENAIQTATAKHNVFLKELGLPLLPLRDSQSLSGERPRNHVAERSHPGCAGLRASRLQAGCPRASTGGTPVFRLPCSVHHMISRSHPSFGNDTMTLVPVKAG